MGVSYGACREDRGIKKIIGKLCEYMKIPDKASVTLRKASDVIPGAEKITNGWQFGIFSDAAVLSLTIFECGEPDGGMTIEIPQEFKCG